jgi:hypothetical protein
MFYLSLRAYICTQVVPRGKVNIHEGHSIGHSKQKCYTYMCSIPNGFCTLYSGATRHVLTQVAKCIGVDGGILENVLY